MNLLVGAINFLRGYGGFSMNSESVYNIYGNKRVPAVRCKGYLPLCNKYCIKLPMTMGTLYFNVHPVKTVPF